MLAVVVVACVVVLIAMSLDLASGIYKAKQRGELRTSQALKRTLSKFIAYEGGMLIAAGVDLLMCLSRLPELFGLVTIQGVPVVTCLVGVFLLVVEFISIREKADAKTKKQISDTAELLAEMMKNDTLKKVLETAVEKEKEKQA